MTPNTAPTEAADTERNSLGTHVSLCEMRYEGLKKRLSRIEIILFGIVLLLLFGQGTVTEVAKRLLLP
jgi:hypothetical protein